MINTFKAYLATELTAGGSETTIYLDRITTLTGETVATGHFTTLGRGILSVNPDGDGLSSYPEWISFTAVSGTTLTGASRGLSALSNSVVTANKRFHPVGTAVVISFGVHNLLDLIGYIDDEVAAITVGTAAVALATAGETITAGQLVYLKNDGKWWKTDADTAATLDNVQLGLAQGAGAADGAISGGVMLRGLDTNQSGLVAGTTYYASNTAGGISSSAGTNSRVVGIARSTTTLYFNPDYDQIPTVSQKAAFVGTSGTPSAANPFATKATTDLLAKIADIQTYTASDTWTKPTGAKLVMVELWGAGGGGGRSTTSSSGGGGGGGSYTQRVILASALGATVTVTIGAGGAGATSTGNGSVGGNTTFGSFLTAYGGGGGGGQAGQGAGGGGGGMMAAGGSASAGTFGVGGNPKEDTTNAGISGTGGGCNGQGGGNALGVSVFGGGGGAQGEASATKNGGDSLYGGGGGGGGRNSGGAGGAGGTSVHGGAGGVGATGTGVVGGAGVQPGGGGGGAFDANGGAGAAGQARVTTFF